ncbi:RagB/SusD family nutrient uptake outer membrane protein [Mucilaginibacter terrae]|uniref:RagB/SusD family nutrient uptake outer membrane protein n=1 Tax=Mucilaginibacter terrae TaxID=1955052 RepID=UPI00362941FE
MKNIKFYLSLVILSFAAGACKREITQPIYGVQNVTEFYKTESQVQQALTGVYIQLKTYGREFSMNHMLLGDNSTDDGVGEDPLGQFVPVFPNESVVTQRWQTLYLCIARANEVITLSSDAVGNQATITKYINEAKLLRGFCYYSLVTAYGGVPLFTKPVTPNEALTTPRSTADEVWAQVISDITAGTALPARPQLSAADKFRVTRGLAYALLGKVYMFRRDFTNAELALKTVVESGDYTLLADYGNNWRTEGSTESVFEIPYTQTTEVTLQIGTQIPQAFSPNIAGNANYTGGNGHQPTLDLYNEFDLDDPRITYTFTQTGDRFLNDAADQDNSVNYRTRLFGRKTTVPYYLRSGFTFLQISYNVRLIRFADILLLYAEVLNENGKSGQALTYLNQIRTRARQTPPLDPQRSKHAYVPPTNIATSLPNVTTTDQNLLRLAIWHERRCELGMEGWRREDLIRQKRYGEVMRAYSTRLVGYTFPKQGTGFRDDRDYLLPIPANEVTYTIGVVKQNPNY